MRTDFILIGFSIGFGLFFGLVGGLSCLSVILSALEWLNEKI